MIRKAIDSFTFHCLDDGLLDPMDLDYARNRLFCHFNLPGWVYEPGEAADALPLEDALDVICRHHLKDSPSLFLKDDLVSEITDYFIDRPSGITRQFKERYERSPQTATAWFYQLACQTQYVKTARSAKNVKWSYPCEYGSLDLSINLAKPEKTPSEIALARQHQNDYPYCVLCRENVGLSGALHPPRAHHRIIPLSLTGADYFFQYSPYAYFQEHAIVFSKEHIPMAVNEAMLPRMLDFTDQFPHYFLSSNADLPIVGGSILNHDHFQGGNAHFPIESAARKALQDGVHLIDWPISTALIKGSKEEVLRCSETLRRAWFSYSNEALGIRCQTGSLRHNTLNYLVRCIGKKDYEVYLLFRNNLTTPERPDGLFHTRASLQVIKQENIGVIESIGLAILPPRISAALAQDFSGAEFAAWREEFKRFPDPLAMLGETYKQILTDCGVFKTDERGQQAFRNFLESALEQKGDEPHAQL